MTRSVQTISELLDVLAVPTGGVVYVQSSMDWIRRGGIDPTGVTHALRDWIGPSGTLVMPAYPCRTTHWDYLSSRPTYDVRRTPAAVGLIPESFRREPGAVRSLDPDFCIVAAGKDAEAIARPLADDPDPFGPASPYQRLLDRGATLLGLGVSLNTNSCIHVLDSRLQQRYDRPVYSAEPFVATLVDEEGQSREVIRKALAPEFQRRIEPGALVELVEGDTDIFASVRINDAMFFRWNLPRWEQVSMSHAAAQLASGRLPCWLRRMA